MQATERLYETTDGKLVREGDTRGAFLKFAVGDTIGTDWERLATKATEKGDGAESAAYHDSEVRDAMRVAQADPTAANRGAASKAVHGDAGEPVLIHDGLATELADEARSMANRDLSLVDGETVAKERLFYTDDREGLVKEGDPDGRTLAYAPGDAIKDKDLDSFEAVTDDDDEDDDAAPATAPAPAPDPRIAKKAAPAKTTAAPVK